MTFVTYFDILATARANSRMMRWLMVIGPE